MSKVGQADRDRMRKDAVRRLYGLPERKKDSKRASTRRKAQSGARKTSIRSNHAR